MAFKGSGGSNIKYEVIENYGELTDGDNAKELRLVSWNNREPKYDIRSWKKNEDGTETAGKGITLSGEECEGLLALLTKISKE